MKIKLSGFILFLSLFYFSQELKYEEVVPVDSTTTKDELYNRARTWITQSFKSEKYVIVIDDKNTGEVTGNGSIRYDPEIFYWGYSCAKGFINYKVNIYVKDGRYKYSINTFNHQGTPCGDSGRGIVTSYGIITEDKKSENGPKAGWNEIKGLINSEVPKIISSLKEVMKRPHESHNNW